MPDLLRKQAIHNILLLTGSAVIFSISVMGYGLGITDDSVNYMSAAMSFPSALLKVDGSVYSEWPPLYPVILSLYKLTGMSCLSFATLLHGISFCAIVIILNSMTAPLFRTRPAYLMYIICLLCSIPLLQSSVFLWSESIFILLVILSFRQLNLYIFKPGLASLSFLILISVLLCLQRKSGVIFTGAYVIILFAYRKKERRSWMLEIPSYLILSTTPFILWTYRRFLISGSATSEAAWEPSRIFENLIQSTDILSSWLMPDEIPLILRSLLFLTLIALMILTWKKYELSGPEKDKLLIRSSTITLTVYTAALCLIFLYLRSSEPIDDRLLSPVYPFFILLAFIFLDKVLFLTGSQNMRGRIIIGVVILLPLYCVFRTGYHIKRWNQEGTGGYNTKALAENKLINYLKNEKTGRMILSNNIYVLNYHLNFKAGQQNTITDLEAKTPKYKWEIVYFPPGEQHALAKIGNFVPDLTKGKVIYKDKEGIIIQE
jgi:hypothetical protein